VSEVRQEDADVRWDRVRGFEIRCGGAAEREDPGGGGENPMSRPISRQDVIDCAKSEYSISDTAEELRVSYHRLYRFIKRENLRHLFRHGNASVQKSQKSNVARGLDMP
jgi:hypothetical protein